MRRTKNSTYALALLGFLLGAGAPLVASALGPAGPIEYGSQERCLQLCAGSCTASGRCFLIER